jgi:phosphoglycerate dehydrogenase-like enzyme
VSVLRQEPHESRHFIPVGRLDITPLAARHSEHEFVQVEDCRRMVQALPGAEAMVTSNSYYNENAANAVKACDLNWVQFTTSGIDLALRVGGFAAHTVVTNAPGLSAPVIAEHAFALLLSITRRLDELQRLRAQKEWGRDYKNRTSALYGKTLCIVGLGAVGQQTAKRACAFGMNVIGVSRTPTSTDDVSAIYPRERLLEAIATADVVVLSAVLDAATANIINAAAFAVMKPGTILINVARGELVDEDALIAACRSGQLAGAGLDVAKVEPPAPDSALWTLANVVLTPHLAGSGSDKSELLLNLLSENISRYAARQPLINQVDWKNMRLA